MSPTRKILTFGVAACVGGALAISAPANAWEPTHPVEIIVPAGTGGGADQMARTIQGIITKHNLMKQSMVVINKSGGAGGEGFLDVKNSQGQLRTSWSSRCRTCSPRRSPPAFPSSWKDMTPVAMMALDEFVLWVNAEKPYKTAKEYVDAAKAAPDNTFKMGGTGSKQEDQIITVAIEKATGEKMIYIPYKRRRRGRRAARRQSRRLDASTIRSRRSRNGAPAS